MNNKTEDIAISDMAKTLASLDQSAQFELAYNYITNIKKQNRKEPEFRTGKNPERGS